MPYSSARDRVLDALLTIIASRGLEEVSIREVATAAEVSIGTVQYYCHSKDQMLRMAFEEANERILDRVRGIAKTGPVAATLRTALLEFLPLDPARRVEATVYLAFSARAATSADLASVRHTLIVEQHRLCADTYRLAQQRGEATGDFDAEQTAWATVALIDGLLLNLLSDPTSWSADTAVAVLDEHLRTHLRLEHERSAERERA